MTTLDEVQDEFLNKLFDGDQVRCPCCERDAKLHARQIYSTITRQLVMAYRKFGLEFGYIADLKDVGFIGGDYAKLRYWGLVEEEDKVRSDGGRAGCWRVTEKGEQWINGEIKVPKFALIYDGELFGFKGKQEVSIEDCLGKKFSLRELMSS
jgi:hypothetical protein